jgi:hypothetical protein
MTTKFPGKTLVHEGLNMIQIKVVDRKQFF